MYSYLQRIYNLLTRRVIYHGVGWCVYISILLLYQIQREPFGFVFTNEVLKLFFLATAVYFNILYLIPTILSEKKYFTYIASFFAVAIVITPLEVFALFVKLRNFPDYQDRLVEQQGSLYIFNMFALGCSTIFKIISDWVRHQRVQRDLEKQRLQSELKFLRTQINPHFLFNTLNSLYALTLKKSDIAPDIVIKLSDMMRYMLYETNEKRVHLSKEITYLENYIALEQLRIGSKTTINMEVLGEIKDQKIAPLLFTPFIENAFKHGISNSIENAFVNLSISVNDGIIHLDLSNSKNLPFKKTMPISAEKSEKDIETGKKAVIGGIGLVNVRRRLDLIYPESYDLRIKDTETVYNVHLTLNLNGVL